MNFQSQILRLLTATAACAMLAGACGDDEAPRDSITPGINNPTVDAGADATPDEDVEDKDAADKDTNEESDTGSPDAQDPDGGIPPAEGPFCEALNLGTLAPNESMGTILNLADAQNEVQLSCGQGVVARELMVRFAVEQTSRIKISQVTDVQSGLNLQINRGACGAPAEVACFNGGAQNIIAEAGVEYFLTLESVVGAAQGEVELKLESEALGCYPAASSVCDGDEVQHCETGFELATYTCSLGCEIDACAGDTCDNAIAMDPSGTMHLEGSLAGYKSHYNMRGRNECFDSGFAISTGGADILVALDGLSAGQTVRVDASEAIGDVNDNAIFITKGCASSTPECVAGGDSADEKLNWEVPEDGDYMLVIDLVSAASDTFSYQITVDE